MSLLMACSQMAGQDVASGEHLLRRSCDLTGLKVPTPDGFWASRPTGTTPERRGKEFEVNLTQLQMALSNIGVDERAYRFGSPGIGECYVIAAEGDTWSVYYSERGNRNSERHFDDEDSACIFFFGWVTWSQFGGTWLREARENRP